MTRSGGLVTEGKRSDSSRRSRRGRRVLTLILILLLLTLGVAVNLLIRIVGVPGNTSTNVDTGGIEWVRSIYGMSDAAADQLQSAQMAAPDTDGSLWITDGVHGSLMRFSSDGRFLSSIKGPADEPLVSPARLTVGPNGLLYACEPMSDVVRVLDKNGNDAGSFGIPQPVSVAVSDDRIVVGAVSGFAILDLEGKPIKVLGSRGNGDDQFDYVHGVAIGSDGTIYVADSYNNRLSAYDRDGKRLWMIRTGNPGNGAEMVGGKLTVSEATDAVLKGADALQLPLGLTIDGAGRIVVIDMFGCSLAVFEPDGTFVGKYGEAGAEDGQFFYPTSVAYDPNRDWFAVADTLNNRVQIVRIPGSSGGAAATAAVQRALSGPLRACLLPFLLLVAALIASLVVRARRKKRTAHPELMNDYDGVSEDSTEGTELASDQDVPTSTSNGLSE
jgi:sugar lactone lactonase YvrE